MWRVDLENYCCIECIVIYLRMDNKKWGEIYLIDKWLKCIIGVFIYNKKCIDILDVNNGFIRRFLGFLVVVLNMIDYNYGVICYYERKYNKYMIFFIVDFFCFVVGWYVIFYNERCLGISYLEDYS